MFEVITDKLQNALASLNSKGRLSESDIDSALREIRRALLESDVNFKVAREFVQNVRSRTLESEVLNSVSPGQVVLRITAEELTKTLGEAGRVVRGPAPTSSLLLVGLNGSGKTTTAAKLASLLNGRGESSLLVAADLFRPAAIDQVELLASRIGVEVYSDRNESSSVKVAKEGLLYGQKQNHSWVIVDTAGRSQIDEVLMVEIEQISDAVAPTETLLVVDSMMGQDAVSSAVEFNDRIGLTGLVLTKLDGDARGGAALSIASVTGLPIKFIGVGENTDALELFYPDRIASRILGMGDVKTLTEKVQLSTDLDQSQDLERKVRQGGIDLNDFLQQMQQIKKMGSLSQFVELIPGFSSMKSKLGDTELDDSNLVRVEAIIHSMTQDERTNPSIINGSRRRRIALGSGTKPSDVNQLLNQFRQMKKQLKALTNAGGKRKMQDLMKQQGFMN